MAKSVAKACGSPWKGTMVFCRSMPTTVCFVKKKKKKKIEKKKRLGVQLAAKRKRKTKSTYYAILYWTTEAKTLCLRILPGFAGVLWKKIRTRASFDKPLTNYISL